MSDLAIEVDSVWKKFHRGEFHDSLRDFVPAVARRLVGRGPKREEPSDGDFWALKDVSFQVRRGEVLGIIGRNGAGKSTLFKVLSKILKPNRGQIRVNGRLRALIEVAAGFHPDLTGRENIYLNGSILGMKKREIDAKFDEIVEFSGIGEFLDTPVKRYSSGMHARLGFAVAAHLDPDVLLVDEILSVGDAAFQVKCYNHMETLTKTGVTVAFVSHNLGAVAHLCSKAILLRAGQVVMHGPSAEVITAYKQDSLKAACGTDAAEVLGFTIRDLQGGEVPSLKAGNRYEAHLRFRVRQEMPDCAIAVVFLTRSHSEIFNTTSLRLGLPSRDYRPGDIEDFVFQFDANLATGCYGIAIRLQRYTPRTIYWEREPLVYVDVIGQNGTAGSAYLNFTPMSDCISPGDANGSTGDPVLTE